MKGIILNAISLHEVYLWKDDEYIYICHDCIYCNTRWVKVRPFIILQKHLTPQDGRWTIILPNQTIWKCHEGNENMIQPTMWLS